MLTPLQRCWTSKDRTLSVNVKRNQSSISRSSQTFRVPSACCKLLCSSFDHSSLILITRTAVEALAQSGYQPSRTLVFSLILAEVRHPFHSFNCKVSDTFRLSIRPPIYRRCLITYTPRTTSMDSKWVSSYHLLCVETEDLTGCGILCAFSSGDCTWVSPPYFLFGRRPATVCRMYSTMVSASDSYRSAH